MSHQFKSGDLALIVGSNKGISPNIGTSVELVQKLLTNAQFSLPDGRQALNRGPACWMVQGEGLFANLHRGSWENIGGVALVEERHLIPLRGDFAPDKHKAKEAEPCA